MVRQFSNTSKSMRLLADVSAVGSTILVDDATGLPATFPYFLVLDPDTSLVEVVSVTASSGNTLTVARGQQDTPASAHAVNAVVYHAWTALDGQEAQDHYDASGDVHGIGNTASVVGTDTAQTLTFKLMSGSDNTFTDLPAEEVVGVHKNIVAEGSSAANVPITARAVTGQTGDLQRWQDESGVNRTTVNAAGELVLPQDVRTSVSGTTIHAPSLTTTGDFRFGGTAAVTRDNTSDDAYKTSVTGDSVDRLVIDADGSIHLGPGNAVRDVHVYRDSANTLGVDNNLYLTGGVYADGDIETPTGDVVASAGRFGGNGPSDAVFIGDDAVLADANLSNAMVVKGQQDATQGAIYFGSGLDTNLYRSAANTLKTDDSLHVANDVQVGADGTGNLTVNGTADINGAADISGALNVGGALTAANMVCGTVSMNPVANTPTTERVNFGTTLTAPIRVWVTAQSGFIGSQVEGVGVTDLDTTGFDCVIYRTNTTATNVFWLAIGGSV